MAPRKKKSKGPSKTDAIRELLESSPEMTPREMAEKLSSKNMTVTAAYVSAIKSTLKKRKGAIGKSKRSGGTRSRQASNTAHVNVDALVEAKVLVEKAGGVDEARRALDVLSKLQ